MTLPPTVLDRNNLGQGIARSQRGAVLFISLILLVVLSLIGIAGMQVTTLQERMAGNYLLTNTAFENAEATLRQKEAAVGTAVSSNGGGVYYAANDLNCTNLDMTNWANTQTMTGGAVSYVMLLNACAGQSGNSLGTDNGPIAGGGNIPPGNQLYMITAVSADTGSTASANAASMAVLQSVYIP